LVDQGLRFAVDVHLMRTRPIFMILLAVVIIGAGIGATVVTASGRADHRNLGHAQAVAHAMVAPAGATKSIACHADGLVSCWVVKGSAAQVASAVSAGLTGPAGKSATQSCRQLPVGSPGSSAVTDECSVIVRYGAHGVFAFFGPQVSHDADGRATVTGTLVTVSAA
jgi:hypothetical protein